MWLNQVLYQNDTDLIPSDRVRAIIAPHAGFAYSGPASAYAYKSVVTDQIERVFILGPSHKIYLDSCALSKCSVYHTPLGSMELDEDIISSLKNTGHFSSMTLRADEDEHSIEMHLPFVQKIMERYILNSSNMFHNCRQSYKIIPILVGSLSTSKLELYGTLFAPYLSDPKNLFVISSDFCHWGQRFSFTYTNGNAPIYKAIEELDRRGMNLIERLDSNGFAAYLQETGNTICGRYPISVLLSMVDVLVQSQEKMRKADADAPTKDAHDSIKIRCKFTHYSQSSSAISLSDSSVSYASAYLYIDH